MNSKNCNNAFERPVIRCKQSRACYTLSQMPTILAALLITILKRSVIN